MSPARRIRGNPLLALLVRVEKSADPNGCWLWTGSITPKGYGLIRAGGRVQSVHRFAYEALVGPIPDGLQLDHLCRVRNCVNPDHLEPVTGRINQQRGLINQNAPKETCDKGHPFDYTYTGPNGRPRRRCKTCTLEYKRVWRKRKRMEAEREKGDAA